MIYNFRSEVNEIYLSTFAAGNYNLSQEQIDVLYTIATEYSPWEGGDAVYMARLMLNIDDDEINADYVFGHKGQQNDELNSKVNVKLYPNPANENIVLEFNHNIVGNAMIEIYGFTGNLLQQTQINSNSQIFTISTKNLQNGIYFYKIIYNNEVLNKDKLLIVR